MEIKAQKTDYFFLLMMPLAAAAFIWAFLYFPVHRISFGMFVVTGVAVLLGSFLRFRVPRTRIDVSLADVLIAISFFLYGGSPAVITAALESTANSLNLRRQGNAVRAKTIVLGVAIAAISLAVATNLVEFLFGAMPSALIENGWVAFSLACGLTAFSLAFINSLLVASFLTLRNETSFFTNWGHAALNTLSLIIVVPAAALAVKLVEPAMAIGGAVGLAVIAGIGLIYKRYVDDVRAAADIAQKSERERAEQAERHIVELQRHIAEQEKTSEALRESKEKYRHAAFHDSLTGLPNRNLFIETLKFALQKHKQTTSYNFAVMFLDLNRFKTINESLGHSIGNSLILTVGQRLREIVRKEDLLARFGGDEFGIILTDVKSIEDVVAFAQIINHKFSSPFNIDGREVFISASIGISFSNPSYAEAEEVLRDADIAMYYAKDHRKTYEIFNQTMHTRAVTLHQIETDLRYAIERGELCAHYQPIVSLDTMRLSGFESLIRWNHPLRGMIPPGEFIPVAEETGLVIPITYWMLEETCRQMVRIQRLSRLEKPLFLSVNLSGRHFAHADIVERIQEIIVKTEIPPQTLKLEITESAMMDNPDKAIAALRRLKGLGIQLSIDDFGTGYSSLSYLHRFPIDTLKVDRSFVSSMEDGTENGEIVRTVIALAKTLRLDVVAEGIESIHQLHQLRILGCEYGQGYLFSRPVPLDEMERISQDTDRWQNIIPDNNPATLAQNREFSQLRIAK